MSTETNTPTIKKTMIEVLAFVTAHGNMSKENLDTFTNDFCIPKTGSTTSNGPREITILKDIDGEQLGRKCSVTGVWFDNSFFSKGTTCIKEADAAKGKLYTASKVMEKDAQVLLAEAKDITDIEEKVAKYEEYDAKLAEAKAHRLQDVTVEVPAGGFDTIEALAEDMGVEVNPVAPAEDAE